MDRSPNYRRQPMIFTKDNSPIHIPLLYTPIISYPPLSIYGSKPLQCHMSQILWGTLLDDSNWTYLDNSFWKCTYITKNKEVKVFSDIQTPVISSLSRLHLSKFELLPVATTTNVRRANSSQRRFDQKDYNRSGKGRRRTLKYSCQVG